jgi:hypothetical protein
VKPPPSPASQQVSADSVRLLLSSIRDPKIAATAGEAVRLAQAALVDLEGLDESLYHRFKDSEGELGEDTGAVITVRALLNGTFKGLRALLAFCRQLRPQVDVTAVEGEADFGDLEAMASKPEEDDLALGLGDIGALLDGIDEHEREPEPKRFAALQQKLSSIEYGLSSQLAELEGRVKLSLNVREVSQAIEAIDDTQGATSQGVFAVLSAVCEAFAPGIDSASLAPGHLTTLQRALLVRRGLADLGRSLMAPHERLQREQDPEQAKAALLGVRQALSKFLAGEPFAMMRPADRWQLAHFDRTMSEQSVSAARLTSEGLSKYLESLSSINQREVLVLHDRRAATDLREAKAAAEQLAIIEPRLALESTQTALESAMALYGHSAPLDEAILALPERMASVERLKETFAALERIAPLLP